MYELIARNRRMSWLLLFASFAFLVLVAVAVSVYLQAGIIGVAFGVIVSVGMTFTAYWSSDKVALAATRARPATIEEFGQLHNIVEGLSIAAGIPKPRVYVVDDPAPNAFATGRDPEHAAIAATTGLLALLNRAELEGVMAHELSHVRNYDIRVSTIVVATAGAVAMISDIFWRMMWFGGGRRRGNDNGGGGNPIALIGLLIVIVVAPVAAALIRAAVSRRREALADASAVELTRYPTGLRQALEKLATNGSVVQHTSHATAHLWIESPLERGRGNEASKLNSMFDTHPPLEERIATLRELEGLDTWDGTAPTTLGGTALGGAAVGGQVGRIEQGRSGRPPGHDRASAAEVPVAGWYPDPAGVSGRMRYWDGRSWTDQVHPA